MGNLSPFPVGSYCSSRAWGGLEMNVLRLLRWMRERDWPTFLYTRPDSIIYERAHSVGIPVRAIVSESKLANLFDGRKLARLTADDHLRVLTLHRSHDLLMAVMAKKYRRDLKVIYSQHMHIAGNKKDLLHAWQFRALDAFVTPVNWLANQVKQRTVLDERTIRVVPRGIEVQQFVNKPVKAEARKELKLPIDAIVIGIIGRLDPKKGQDVVLRALRRVHDAGHDAHLLVVGAQTLHENTGYEAYLQSLCKELRLTPRVHFRPHQENPELAFAALDIFVLASESETYGMVTIEALASGLPVIGSDAGGTTDLVHHEVNGLRFPPGDDAALAESLLRYLNNRNFASAMATAAQEEAVERYSHIAQCDAWEKLLTKLAD